MVRNPSTIYRHSLQRTGSGFVTCRSKYSLFTWDQTNGFCDCTSEAFRLVPQVLQATCLPFVFVGILMPLRSVVQTIARTYIDINKHNIQNGIYNDNLSFHCDGGHHIYLQNKKNLTTFAIPVLYDADTPGSLPGQVCNLGGHCYPPCIVRRLPRRDSTERLVHLTLGWSLFLTM